MQMETINNSLPRITDSKGISELLGISEATLIRAKKRGEIPYMIINGTHRYNVDKVVEALEKRSHRK